MLSKYHRPTTLPVSPHWRHIALCSRLSQPPLCGRRAVRHGRSARMERSQPVDQPPTVNIRGRLVALGPLRRDLVPLYTRWENDFATLRTDDPSAARPITLEEQLNDYD